MTAIVLAAGRGSRMGPLTATRPKCLLPLDSETVLDRQLRLLRAAGILQVVIVTGYRSEDIATHLGQRPGVAIVYNPLHEGTRPISSLLAARDYLNADTVILNADLVFSGEAIGALLSSSHHLVLEVSRTRSDSAHVPVILERDRILDIGKHVPADRANAEFCCIGHVDATGASLLKSYMEECSSDLQKGWSWPFLQLSRRGHPVHAVYYEGPLFDINEQGHYAGAFEFTRTSLP